MFNHSFLGSPDFLERLQGTLCGFQEIRARRLAAQHHAAYASPAATMHAAPVPRSAPTQSPPGGGRVLLCYQHVQGRLVPVYASPDDLPGATAHGGAPSPETGPPRPEPAPQGATAPASPPPAAPSGGPQERTPPVSAANSEQRAPVEPPDFSAQAVQASVPPRTSPTRPASTERAPAALNLAPPTPPPIVRPTEEKTNTIERILAQHRTEMEAAEARHAAAVEGIHAQHRAEMEAAEARHAAGLHGALAECRQMVSELLARHREALGQQQKPGADDAQAFAELRELLAEQARVMQAEHDKTAGLTSDLLEMINNLGETVNHLAVAVAERKAPPFAPPPKRLSVSDHDAVRKPGPPMTAPVLSTVRPTPAPAARGPELTTPRAATTTATAQNSGPGPAAAAHAGAEVPPAASAKSEAPNPETPATSPVLPPAAHDAAPTRSLTVVRDSEPIRRAAPPAVRPTAPSAVLSSVPARACATSVSASLMSLFASSPPATVSASMTARQRKAAEEARERDHIYDAVGDVTDEELEDMQTESEAPRG